MISENGAENSGAYSFHQWSEDREKAMEVAGCSSRFLKLRGFRPLQTETSYLGASDSSSYQSRMEHLSRRLPADAPEGCKEEHLLWLKEPTLNEKSELHNVVLPFDQKPVIKEKSSVYVNIHCIKIMK